MKLLFNPKLLKSAKSADKFPCECIVCHKTFYKQKRSIIRALSGKGGHIGDYCSSKCNSSIRKTSIKVNCTQCNKIFEKELNQIKKSSNHFCSRSCSGLYNSLHKTTGTRRSKLEIYLENKLLELFPNLEIHFNRKDTINSELDIYIPSLNLAFELNGIFHYEPIYGKDKLIKIQNNDSRKFQACLEQGIEFCTIDTSKQKYFKEKTSIQYLEIIKSLIIFKISNYEQNGKVEFPTELWKSPM